MSLGIGQKITVGTYTDIDGQKNITGVVKKTGITNKEEAIQAAKSDDSVTRKWFGVGKIAHTAIYQDTNGTYSLLKLDKDYTQSIAYGEESRSPGQANPNVEFID